ncbi:DUF2637 domain-containing protein [Micromonospora sp. CA-111912]|uniref:DUF2637 domain-containing protein n=1 Tax=Micromonospora sp. CA-111912 TaxID=3239955 RepID=UPI003D92DBAF
MLTIGGAAGAASFRHVHDVSAAHGQGGWLAWANAVTLELMSIAAGLEVRRRTRTGKSKAFPVTVLVVAVFLSLGAQVIEAEPSVVGWLAAALPAAGFLMMAKIALARMSESPAATLAVQSASEAALFATAVAGQSDGVPDLLISVLDSGQAVLDSTPVVPDPVPPVLDSAAVVPDSGTVAIPDTVPVVPASGPVVTEPAPVVPDYPGPVESDGPGVLDPVEDSQVVTVASGPAVPDSEGEPRLTKVQIMESAFAEAVMEGRDIDHRELARLAGADLSHARRVRGRLLTAVACLTEET